MENPTESINIARENVAQFCIEKEMGDMTWQTLSMSRVKSSCHSI